MCSCIKHTSIHCIAIQARVFYYIQPNPSINLTGISWTPAPIGEFEAVNRIPSRDEPTCMHDKVAFWPIAHCEFFIAIASATGMQLVNEYVNSRCDHGGLASAVHANQQWGHKNNTVYIRGHGHKLHTNSGRSRAKQGTRPNPGA